MSLCWFAVTTPPLKERLAALSLQPVAAEVRVPMEQRTVRRHRRAKGSRKISLPILAGYVFVGFAQPPSREDWQAVLARHHVRKVIGMREGQVLPMREGDGWEARMDLSRLDVPDLEAERWFYAPGDDVLVTAGAFDSVPARCVEVINASQAKVLLQMFGSTMEMTIPYRAAIRSQVVPVDKKAEAAATSPPDDR
jgi:transcription antitermination factor NusG